MHVVPINNEWRKIKLLLILKDLLESLQNKSIIDRCQFCCILGNHLSIVVPITHFYDFY